VIGVFDSGVGGLSVLRALVVALPDEDYIYVADSAHCPYGARSAEEIRTLSLGIGRYLADEGARLIVVACNTASAAALSALREDLAPMPIVGMVPAVKPAAARTQSGVVGVLATPATFGGALYADVVEHHAHGVRVLSQACHGLVERIEAGDLEGPETLALLRGYAEPLLAAGADTLVLGCTHYPFVIPALRRIVGEGVAILEPSEAIARQTARVLPSSPTGSGSGRRVYATTGSPSTMSAALERLLGVRGEVRALTWRDGGLCRA
jgi:glutamate racemase